MRYPWKIRNRDLVAGEIPLLMGILNVTPDSFSDGGLFERVEGAVAQAKRLTADGADIIDIGGESTRPGADAVSEAEELRRTIPVIEALRRDSDVLISIDTTKAEVARSAIAAGADIVNDVSGLTFDSGMLAVCADSDVAVCAMHIKGTPQTMQQNPEYDDVVVDVGEFLEQRMAACVQAGISVERICLDPGIGFGKTAEHNLALMKSLDQLHSRCQRPLLIGHSRKRFLSKLLGREVNERTFGTVGVSVALAQNGADVLRVHDVQATRDALLAWRAVQATGVAP